MLNHNEQREESAMNPNAHCTCHGGRDGYWCKTCILWHHRLKALELTRPWLAKRLRRLVD